ncbi:hypothetical protein GCM10008995_26440 [Halobellus salinus]|uniref:Uncharacterized protein n=1 Tax=Halobellus salinus TaxID=931585 RepID=A0A830ERR9_9EURY|nr:hypothetical protein [Halobellus salinus]GGJ15315.1 hypothetical protein GCM10008995_26440 [Halobellus salinus]SMP25159.1 hypothetical protein SAMN06265347_110115 [Halobellus salinus]
MGIEHFLDSETGAESQDSENETEAQDSGGNTEAQNSETEPNRQSSDGLENLINELKGSEEFLKDLEDKPYSPWISKDGTLTMFELEPHYVKENISTDLKDEAKERGLLFFDCEKEVIVFTGEFTEYYNKIDAMGLDWCIKREQREMQRLCY